VTVGFVRAFCRLFVVQGAWNYERMTGVGLGYAAEPLLEDLQSADPARHAEAAVRSAEYFNSHPYLAGAALGALVRAEYDQVPGAQIARLRAALTSPLGALGDQFFWAGLVPAMIGAAILGVVSGHAKAALILVLAGYNAVRIATGVWALRIGLANGVRVGAALGASWLPRYAPKVGLAAGLMVGMALPLAARWLLEPHSARELGVAAGTTLVALWSVWKLGPKITSIRFGLAVIGLAALLAWGRP
jgi:mannose PTS system EIID component